MPGLAYHRTPPLEEYQYLPPLQLSVIMVTCGPGPQTSRPHGTRYRPQTGYKLQVRAAADRGQGAGPRPASGPGPLPRSPRRYTGGSPPLPLRGPQTPPSGPPQRPGLGKDGQCSERERVGDPHKEATKVLVREGPKGRDVYGEWRQVWPDREREGRTGPENQTQTAKQEGEGHK